METSSSLVASNGNLGDDFQPEAALLYSRIASLYAELDGVRELRTRDTGPPESREGALSQVSGSVGATSRGRLILVSRQLPYKFTLAESGRWQAESKDTMMDQALENFKIVHERFDCVWIGWPGLDVEPGQQMALREFLSEKRMVPVFLDPDKEERFYAGFCKSILWPLFHSAMPTTDDTIARSHGDGGDDGSSYGNGYGSGYGGYSSGYGGYGSYGGNGGGREHRGGEQLLWKAYRAVNQTFADATQDVYRDGDLVWVQDYHLLVLPQMLRTLLPAARMAFFLHLPFPSSEIYRILPFRTGVLEGLLSADLLGFQTYDYARHFLSTVESLLDAECSPQRVVYNGHVTNVAICPVGIDPDTFAGMARSHDVELLMDRYNKHFAGKKVMLGVDNVDSTKGLVLKFLAIEELYEREASVAQNVVFVQVGFSGNRDQSTLDSQIHRIVERINSKLASVAEAGPVQYKQDLDPASICALYCLADVLVVTPVRDGMNIVPFEYVVSREAHGRLASVVLSEFAGCARSLGGAMLVNPWDTNDVAEKMLMALRMETEEREMRHSNMLSYVQSFTSTSWCTRMVEQLQEANESGPRTPARLLPAPHVLQAFTFCRWRLIVLNLEGILARPCSLAELVELPPDIVDSLKTLSREPYTMVVVKSPRGRSTLQLVLGDTNCVLAAEHGAFVRWGRHAKWQAATPHVDMTWKGHLKDVLQYYTERTPGAVVEERESSIAWHYRDCDLGHGAWQAKQLRSVLQGQSRRYHFTVYAGDKVLEVLPQSVNAQVQSFLETVMRKMRQIIKRSRARGTSFYGGANGGGSGSSSVAGSPSAAGDGDGWVVRRGGGGGPAATSDSGGAGDVGSSGYGKVAAAPLPGTAAGMAAATAATVAPSNGAGAATARAAGAHPSAPTTLSYDSDETGGAFPASATGAAGGGGSGGGGGRAAGSATPERATPERFRFHNMITGVDLGAEFASGGGGRDRVVMLDTPMEQTRSRASTVEVTPPRTRNRGGVNAPGSVGRGGDGLSGGRPRASSEDVAGRLSGSKAAYLDDAAEPHAGEGIFAVMGGGSGGGFGGWNGGTDLPQRLRGASLSVWNDDSDDSASTDVEDDPEADVEFVLVIANGQDLNDEDMFEAMAPPPEYGLEEFLEHVGAIQSDDGAGITPLAAAAASPPAVIPLGAAGPSDLTSFTSDGLPAFRVPMRRGATIGPGSGMGSVGSLGGGGGGSEAVSGSAATAAALGLLPYRAPHAAWEYGRAPASPRPSMASRNMGVGLRDPQTITPLMQRASPGAAAAAAAAAARSPVRSAEGGTSNFAGGAAGLGLFGGPAAPARVSSPFDDKADNSGSGAKSGSGSRVGLSSLVSTSMRRQDVSMHSKFAPRRDYPPASMLFLAMRRKYGEAFGRHELPDTPAECWALVLSTQEALRGSTWRPPPLEMLAEGGPAPGPLPARVGSLTASSVSGGGGGGGGGSGSGGGGGGRYTAGYYDDVGLNDARGMRNTSGAGQFWERATTTESDPASSWDEDPADVMNVLPIAIARALSMGALPAASMDAADEAVSGPLLPSSAPPLPSAPASAVQLRDLQGRRLGSASDAGNGGSGGGGGVGAYGGFGSGGGGGGSSVYAGPVEERSRTTSVIDPRGLDLPINSFACTVGLRLSQAPFYMKNRAAVASLLGELARSSRQEVDAPDSYEDDMAHVPFAIAEEQPPHISHLHSASETDVRRLSVVPAANPTYAAVNATMPGLRASGGGGGNGGAAGANSISNGGQPLTRAADKGWSPGGVHGQARSGRRRQMQPVPLIPPTGGQGDGNGMHRQVKSEASLSLGDVMRRPPLPRR